ncbi:MAG: long-chain fatty acid--CoA ligase [Alphaproteobacteria bacterium]|nr:long-chain fatty acid--CoA ligase [Alphaproteobacteria bacterium]
MSETNRVALADTIPKMLAHNALEYADRPAFREKDLGIWQSWTWRQVYEEVRALACGLRAVGLKRGDKISIIGDNRPHLYWVMAAAQSLGAVPVPIYQDSIADETLYVLDHAEARMIVVEDQEQVDKVLSVKDRVPRVEFVVYRDARGLRHYEQPFLRTYAALVESGRKLDVTNPAVLDAEIATGKGSDLAIILYTSGTTGRSKGALLTHDNLIVTARNANQSEHIHADEDVLAYLPMAWAGDHIFSYVQAIAAGFTVNCPESPATVMNDLREIGPTFFFAPPRIFENILTQVMIRMEDAGWLKRQAFKYFMAVARRCGAKILERKPVALVDRLLYAMGQVLVYAPLRNVLGFRRIRRAYTAGEAIGPDIFDFYRSIGVNVKQLFGMTEASVYITMQPDDDAKPDTVGLPMRDVEIKISETGEVMFRSPGVFKGYYKNQEATVEALTADGWFRTGDAGFLAPDGHLKIIDRAKDVGRLTDGTLFAPKYIENKLKFFPNIKEAVCLGDGKPYVSALINIDLDAVGNWAERQGITYTSYTDLAGRPEVYDLIQANIERVNRDLERDPNLAGSQIRRFLILHKELDADDGELTRTRKVRRRIIADSYGMLISALYSDKSHIAVEAKVTYEDGRAGLLKADVAIRKIELADVPVPLWKAS